MHAHMQVPDPWFDDNEERRGFHRVRPGMQSACARPRQRPNPHTCCRCSTSWTMLARACWPPYSQPSSKHDHSSRDPELAGHARHRGSECPGQWDQHGTSTDIHGGLKYHWACSEVKHSCRWSRSCGRAPIRDHCSGVSVGPRGRVHRGLAADGRQYRESQDHRPV